MHTFLFLVVVMLIGAPYAHAQYAASLNDYTLTYFPADTLSGEEKGVSLCGQYFLVETNTRRSGGSMILFSGRKALFGPSVSAIIGQHYQSLVVHAPLENVRLIVDDTVLVPILVNPQEGRELVLRMNNEDIAKAPCLTGGQSL